MKLLDDVNQPRKKPRPAKPIKQPVDVDAYYRAQLQSLVRLMAKRVNDKVLPIIKEDKEQYIKDGLYTKDDWSDRITAALDALAAEFTSSAFDTQFRRIAQVVVERANSAVTKRLIDSVNAAVGVNIRPLLSEREMNDFIRAEIEVNTRLIRSVPEQYLYRVENAVYQGMIDGDAPTTIAKNIQHETGVTYRRAKNIARDQTSKLTGAIVERRQDQAGITHYRSVDSGDERTTGNPNGKYPNAKISCWGIARKDIGFGPGVYTWKEGASWGGQTGLHPGNHHPLCRCTATPVFDFELPERK